MMTAIADVLRTAGGPKAERLAAQKRFLATRHAIWDAIYAGRFPDRYVSGNKTFTGAPRRTAIRCDFLLASKIALGARYRTDRISDLAQRELLFYVLRDREAFPSRTGMKFYCCPRCTSKLHECLKARVFRYVDNAKWQARIEAGGK
jgi:hypothetical protein